MPAARRRESRRTARRSWLGGGTGAQGRQAGREDSEAAEHHRDGLGLEDLSEAVLRTGRGA